MMRSLTARNKLAFINGNLKKPTDDPIKSLKWERANDVVSSWILSSISESIQAGHVYSEIAENIWNELYETYNKSDGSVIFNIHQKINSLTQNESSLSEYYNKLYFLRKEFDGLTDITVRTCEAATKLNDHAKLMKLMQFLNGLDDSYNQVKSHILLMEPLPTVKSAFSILSREESLQKGGSMSSSSSKPGPSAFASKFNNNKFNSNTNNTNRSRNQNNQIPVCKHCNIKGHTIDKCYKLVGYPKDFKPRSDFSNNYNRSFNNNSNFKNFSRNNSTLETSSSTCGQSNNTDKHFLTSEQYNKFIRLISDNQGTEELPANANMAGMALNSFVTSPKWVIDSGASQHMTASDSLLHDTMDVSNLNLRVGHPNGTSAKINKIGNMHFSNSLTLFDVFAVPDFNVNLLSVHKLCKDTSASLI